MKLKHKTVKRFSATLGDDTLFETFFVCVQQQPNRDLKLMYGKASAHTDVGIVHASYQFPFTQDDHVSFYTFGSGEDRVTFGDVRVSNGLTEVNLCLVRN